MTWNGSAYSLSLTVGETNSLHPEGIVDGSGQFDFVKVSILTGDSSIDKPEDTDSEFYMCNATATDGVLSEWIQGNLKFTAGKGADETVNDPALKNGDEARFYAGNLLTISTLDGRNIGSLEFVLSEQGFEQQPTITPRSVLSIRLRIAMLSGLAMQTQSLLPWVPTIMEPNPRKKDSLISRKSGYNMLQ